MPFNCLTALPFDLNPNLVETYYDAYRTFGLMLESAEFQVSFKRDPGDGTSLTTHE